MIRQPSSIFAAFPRKTTISRNPQFICRQCLSIRFASTASQPQKQPTPNSYSGNTRHHNDRVNPPSSTLPAPIVVPERKPGQGKASHLYQTGKSYLGFYKTGIKNIWGNWKAAKELKARLKVAAQKNPPQKDELKVLIFPATSIPISALSRAEFQLLHRSAFDMRRVPLFGLLFLIFGEWLPLIVVFFTGAVPYICRIPTQIEKTRRNAEERRRKSFRGEFQGAEVPVPRKLQVSEEPGKDIVTALQRNELLHISRSLGLSGKFWDRLAPSGVDSGFRLPPNAVLIYKVRRAFAYLERDDHLLIKDGGVKELVDEEVKLACEERGIDVLGRNVKDLRATLSLWEEGRKKGKMIGMLMSRPDVWTKLPPESGSIRFPYKTS